MYRLSIAMVLSFMFVSTAQANTWVEAVADGSDFGAGGNESIAFGGTGGDLAQAQVTLGTGPLSTILGTLRSGQFDVDPYVIEVTDTATFLATYSTVDNANNSPYTPQLALFDVNTFQAIAGVEGGALDGSLLPGTGLYILMVGTSASDPANVIGEQLFDFSTQGVVVGPAAGIASDVWSFYDAGFPAFANESYSISLRGAGFADVPAPGTALVGVIAACGSIRRRRA